MVRAPSAHLEGLTSALVDFVYGQYVQSWNLIGCYMCMYVYCPHQACTTSFHAAYTHIASMLDSTRVHAVYSENTGQCRHPCCTKLDIQVGRSKTAALNVDHILEITGQLGKQSK